MLERMGEGKGGRLKMLEKMGEAEDARENGGGEGGGG